MCIRNLRTERALICVCAGSSSRLYTARKIGVILSSNSKHCGRGRVHTLHSHIWENQQMLRRIWGFQSSYITLQLNVSEFPSCFVTVYRLCDSNRQWRQLERQTLKMGRGGEPFPLPLFPVEGEIMDGEFLLPITEGFGRCRIQFLYVWIRIRIFLYKNRMKYADADPDITLDCECMYSITGVFPYTDHLSYFINGALLIHRKIFTIVFVCTS